jgi:hypothetical protein
MAAISLFIYLNYLYQQSICYAEGRGRRPYPCPARQVQLLSSLL